MMTGISDRWANNKHTVDDSREVLEGINDVGSERGSVSQEKEPIIRRKQPNLTRWETERTMSICAFFSRNRSQMSLREYRREYRVLIIEINERRDNLKDMRVYG